MITLLSCNNNAGKTSSVENTNKSTADTTANTILQPADNSKRTHDTSLYPGSDSCIVQLNLRGVKDWKTIPISNTSGKQLFAVIYKEGSENNVRIKIS